MKTILLFLITILIIGCGSDKKSENDLQKMKLNGNIKSLNIFDFEAIDKFGEIKKGKANEQPI